MPSSTTKLCPFLSAKADGLDRLCEGDRCSLWVSTKSGAKCVFRCLATQVDEILEHTTQITNFIKDSAQKPR